MYIYTRAAICCRVQGGINMEMAKLQRDRLVDAVYQSRRQAILDSSIPPSERLNVEELAQKLGVSLTLKRTPERTKPFIELLETFGPALIERIVAACSSQDLCRSE